MDVAILVAYFIVVAVIGVISTRVIRNREDFVMDGRRFGKTLMIFFSFGAGTHADSAVGVAAQSYKFGLAGIWYQWVMLFTLPIYWLLAPIFRRARIRGECPFHITSRHERTSSWLPFSQLKQRTDCPQCCKIASGLPQSSFASVARINSRRGAPRLFAAAASR